MSVRQPALSCAAALHSETRNRLPASALTPSAHLSLGLPALRVRNKISSRVFLGISDSSILARWPAQLSLLNLIIFITSASAYSSLSSLFFRILQTSPSLTGPNIVRRIVLSQINSSLSSYLLIVQVCDAYVNTGRIRVLYSLDLV